MAKLNLELVFNVDRETIDDIVEIAEKELLMVLFYAPSSPVTPDKAKEIEDWYWKIKKIQRNKLKAKLKELKALD